MSYCLVCTLLVLNVTKLSHLSLLFLYLFRTASKSQINRAYRDLAMKWHPDKHEGDDKKVAEKKFYDIAAAKEVLSDPGNVIVFNLYYEFVGSNLGIDLT